MRKSVRLEQARMEIESTSRLSVKISISSRLVSLLPRANSVHTVSILNNIIQHVQSW